MLLVKSILKQTVSSPQSKSIKTIHHLSVLGSVGPCLGGIVHSMRTLESLKVWVGEHELACESAHNEAAADEERGEDL